VTAFRTAAALAIVLAATGNARGADTRLAEAARDGRLDAVHALLVEGVDVNAPTADGTTPLHWAVYRNEERLVRRLLDAGADANRTNRYGVPPLALACTNANAALVRLLIAAGADPKAAPAGEPVLLTAARTGSLEAVEAIVAAGADVDATEALRGQTALMWAAVENHNDIARYLLTRGAAVDARSKARYTALMFAAREGNLDIARLLVAGGADVNAAAPNGSTVLRMAVDELQYTTAGFLLEGGADPDVTNKAGETALHAAVRGRAPTRRKRPVDEELSAELIVRLLAGGANPNARTPKAPRITDDKVPSSLRPAIDNVVNLGGATPFLLAAQAADLRAMRLLLEHGADPGIGTYENTTTLAIAAGVGFVEGREKTRPESDALAAVRMLADAGVDANAVNERGQTALHGAVYRAGNSIIEFLVNGAGARTDVRDELGRTALELAEQGFNQVSSVIRRESSAALLRRISLADPQESAHAASAVPDAAR
jgi:ankyrin repeat protein